MFQDQALDILPADYWRWWLMSNCPETSDSEFTWEHFQAGVNKDLADVLGNFVSRVTKFCRSRFDECVPEGGEYGPQEDEVIAELTRRMANYTALMDGMEMRKSAAELRAIWVLGNEYLQEAAPWAAFKTDPDRAAAVVRFALNLIAFYAKLSAPFIPQAAAQMAEAVGTQALGWPGEPAEALDALPRGAKIATPENLFTKITDDSREGWAAQFAGRDAAA